jgi:universal stress protein E
MKPVRRILVGIKDPGARALPAVDKAVQLALAFGAELTLFHAIAEPVAAEPFLYSQGGFRRYERTVRAQHLARLERLAAGLRRAHRKLKLRVEAEWDYPVHEAIVRRVRRRKADLVVAEAHAGRRLTPWLLRLTDWELIRTCPVPVMVVKTAGAWRRPRLLAAIDPAHAFAKPAALDAEILKAGEQLAKALRGSLDVMHAFMPVPVVGAPLMAASANVVTEVIASTELQARKAFERSLRGVPVPRSRRHLVKGAPSEAVPRMARALGTDIAVMGAISRSALKRVVIGNTAERVLGALPCDVLVVKPKRFVTRVSRSSRGVQYTVSSAMPLPF